MKIKKIAIVAGLIGGALLTTSVFANCCPGSCCIFTSYKAANSFLKQFNQNQPKNHFKIIQRGNYSAIEVNKK